VLLVLGSGLGELSSNYREFAPRGRMIQVEADLGKLESNYPALGIHADVRLALQALLEEVPFSEADGKAEAAVADLLGKVRERLDGQPLAQERKLIDDIRAAVPEGTQTFWDMTIASYWAWSAWNPEGAPIHTAQGAGGLGYGILREYLTDTFGRSTATELSRPDFVALAQSFGVPAKASSLDAVGKDLAEALRTPGPSVVVVPALLKMFAPTHLEK
jgi:acetolactate synthase-1/2/3 large subunit